MRSSVIALAVSVVVLVAIVAIRSSRAGPPAVVRATPEQIPSAPDGSASFQATPWYGSNHAPSYPQPGLARTAREPNAGGAAADATDTPVTARMSPRPANAVRPPRTSGSPAEFLTDSLFRQLDVDRDGTLTGSEIPTAFRAPTRDNIDPETFATLFHTTVQQTRAKRAVAAYGFAFDPQTAAMPGWFTALDPDAEERVPLARWRAAGRDIAAFHYIDTDGDGVLTRTEVRAFGSRPLANAPAGITQPGATPDSRAPGAAGAATDATDDAPRATKPSRADAILAHYTEVAAELPAPAPGRLTITRAGAPAKPKAAAPAPPSPPAPKPAKPKAAPPGTEVSTLPLPLTGDPHWVERDAQNVAALLAGDQPNILFLGDSITDFLQYGAGQPIWDESYEPLGALNYAIGGIRTSHVLWQIETGQVAMAAPKVIVLLIGSNNLGIGHTPQQTADGVEKIVSALAAQLPDTRVLLLGILPRGFPANDPFRPKITQTNKLLSDLDDGGRVTYLDIGEWFTLPNGWISPEVMSDGAHPTLLGYQLYTFAVWETLMQVLKLP